MRIQRFWPSLVLVALLLSGCFRQASQDVQPTAPPAIEASPVIPATPTDDTVLETPTDSFITPFDTEQGLDTDAFPTLAGPSPTVPFVEPGDAPAEGPGADSVPSGEGSSDLGIQGPTPTRPDVIATPPFASGATFTPVPGRPTSTVPAQLTPQPNTFTGESSGAPEASGADPRAEAEGCIYVVEPGDTAFFIAQDNNISLTELAAANPELDNLDFLFQGQELNIPGCGLGNSTATPVVADEGAAPAEGGEEAAPTTPPQTNAAGQTIHIVQAGENLFRIGIRYGVTVQDIVQANNFASEDVILNVGQELIIPVPSQ